MLIYPSYHDTVTFSMLFNTTLKPVNDIGNDILVVKSACCLKNIIVG